MQTGRMWWRYYRPLISYLIIVGALALAGFLYTNHVKGQLKHERERDCALIKFTRQTQKDVVLYLHRQTEAGSQFAGTLEMRAFYKNGFAEILRLLKRSEPPACES